MDEEPLRRLLGTALPPSTPTRRKVFISYSHLNQGEAGQFVNQFGGRDGVFIPKVLGLTDRDDFIESTNTEYVTQRIRDLYVQDSTVTVVLVGSCTHSRRYIDWEIKASLTQGEDALANGLIGILLPSSREGAYLPPRFAQNWNREHQNCYARYWGYPQSSDQLRGWIDDAFESRWNRSKWIQNARDMMRYNAVCKVHSVTH